MARGTETAVVRIGANSRALDPQLRKARGKFKRFGRRSAKDVKGMFRGVTRTLSTLGGIGVVATLAQSGRAVFGFEKRLTRLQIQSGKTSQFMGQFRKEVRKLSNETGVAADQILDGAAMFVSLTGDMDGATAAAATFAKVATASGASMEDIATSAAALSDSLKIDPKEFEKAFSILLLQGKKGAIELREFAGLAAGASAQFANFGNTGQGGLAEMGGMLQIVRKGFGNSSEAATGFMGLMKQLSSVKVAKQLKKFGIATTESDGKGGKRLRNMLDVIKDIKKSTKLNKDPLKLGKIFSRAEGKRALDMILRNVGAVDDLTAAGLKSNAVQEDFADFQESGAGKMARIWQRMKNAIAKLFTPGRIKRFGDAMDSVAKAVGYLVDNLRVAAALLVGMKVAPGVLALVGGRIGGHLGGLGGGSLGKGKRRGKGKKGRKGGGVGAADVLGVGALAFAVGTVTDELLGLSDKIAGVRGKQTSEVADQSDKANDLLKAFNLRRFDQDGQLKSLAQKYVSLAEGGDTVMANRTLRELTTLTNQRGAAQDRKNFIPVLEGDFRGRVGGKRQLKHFGASDDALNPKGRGQLLASDGLALAQRALEQQLGARAFTSSPTPVSAAKPVPLTPEEQAIANRPNPFEQQAQKLEVVITVDPHGLLKATHKKQRAVRRGR